VDAIPGQKSGFSGFAHAAKVRVLNAGEGDLNDNFHIGKI
jgi:hypothetical protein